MWEQGLIANTALYWKEGMSEWRPLKEYFATSETGVEPPPVHAVPPPPPKRAPSPRYTFAKDPTGLTAFVKTMLWISVLAGIASIVSDLGQLQLIGSESLTPSVIESNDARQQNIAILALAVYVITGIGFLKWIYRANLNSRGFGAVDMHFTPGWSIGYYFIPFINLVRPYQAMKEIWQVSQNPKDWKAQPGSGMLGWWWALWILSAVLGQVSYRLSMDAKDPASLHEATSYSIFSAIVDIPLCFVAMSLISTIYGRQKALVTRGD